MAVKVSLFISWVLVVVTSQMVIDALDNNSMFPLTFAKTYVFYFVCVPSNEVTVGMFCFVSLTYILQGCFTAREGFTRVSRCQRRNPEE